MQQSETMDYKFAKELWELLSKKCRDHGQPRRCFLNNHPEGKCTFESCPSVKYALRVVKNAAKE